MLRSVSPTASGTTRSLIGSRRAIAASTESDGAAHRLVGARHALEQIVERHALEFLDSAPDRPREARRDVLEGELRVGLPQPVGIAALIFAKQQAHRRLPFLERDVETLLLHEGAAVHHHHRQHHPGVDRPDRGDQQGIRGHQHAGHGDAHDQHIGRGRDRDRREDEGGARHHRRGDDADAELLTLARIFEEMTGRESPDDAEEHAVIGDAVQRLARHRGDHALLELGAVAGHILEQERKADQPERDMVGGRAARHHQHDQHRVEDHAPGGDMHRSGHFEQLRRAHASPAAATRGCGTVENDLPVEFRQAFVGHCALRESHSSESVREALSSLDQPGVTPGLPGSPVWRANRLNQRQSSGTA